MSIGRFVNPFAPTATLIATCRTASITPLGHLRLFPKLSAMHGIHRAALYGLSILVVARQA